MSDHPDYLTIYLYAHEMARKDIVKLKSENKLLKAEVERLRKAGDAMVQLLCHMDVVMDMDSDHPEVEAWNAAKEGRPNE